MVKRGGGRGKREGRLGYALGLPLAILMIAPFIYMVATALTGGGDARRVPLGRFLVNSAVFSLAVVAGQVLTSATAAYAFARLRFPGRDRVFLAYLSVLTVPAVLLVIPRFVIIDALGWVDSYQGLISTELVSVAGIFLLRQFFRAIPRDLEDAARLEGADEWTIFWRVFLPASRPALGAFAVLAFADQWRSFLWPLVATRSSGMQPVEVGMANLQGMYDLSWADQMAVAAAAMIPLVILYFVAQKYFVRGMLPGFGTCKG